MLGIIGGTYMLVEFIMFNRGKYMPQYAKSMLTDDKKDKKEKWMRYRNIASILLIVGIYLNGIYRLVGHTSPLFFVQLIPLVSLGFILSGTIINIVNNHKNIGKWSSTV